MGKITKQSSEKARLVALISRFLSNLNLSESFFKAVRCCKAPLMKIPVR